MSYTNADGLFVLTDGDQEAVKDNGGALAATKVLVIEIPDATKLGTAQTAPTANDAFIPAGSYITSASLVVSTAFTSGGAGTLGLGLFTLAVRCTATARPTTRRLSRSCSRWPLCG